VALTGLVLGCLVKRVRGPLACGPARVRNVSNIQNQLKFVNSNLVPSLGLKIFKLFMMLYFNILNNFLNWFDFEFPMDHML
jgi:hypothetical protein